MKNATRWTQVALVGFGMALHATPESLGSGHCPGEIDWEVTDGRTRVTVFDFGVLAASFGQAVPVGTLGDLDGSGFIDVFDFGILAASFGCEFQIVEPGSEPSATGLDGLPRRPVDDFVTGHAGELTHEVVDLHIAGRGIDFAWARKYRSRIGPSTAQGNGWDFSYNLYVEQGPGTSLTLHDGHTRSDTYEDQGGGVWHDEEFFRELTINPGPNTYTLTFPHGDRWELNALDGSPAEGKIGAMVDRNGNTLTFEYDGLGRLTIIRDTLHTPPTNPREIAVAYNPDGFIESVTDWTGRAVTYDYYEDADIGGDSGDLRSVTSPAVVGTPNGNDFPSGKTTTYTYSEGFDNDRVNHNLLTVTDPKGQTYLVVEYGPTEAPEDLEHDRVVGLTLGDPGDRIDIVYAEVAPDPGNGFACMKSTVNDRVGNVSERFYDASARVVLVREHTGRGDPDLPTDLDTATNPPVGPLRPSDPAFFETRYEWSIDSLCTRVVRPNLNETRSVFDEFNPDRRSRGNLLGRTWDPGPLGGDQPLITQLWEYNPAVNFGTNFVTLHTDGRGAATQFSYDGAGNVTRVVHRIPSVVEDFQYNAFGQMTRHIHPDNGGGHRREDAFTYYTPIDGCMNGYPRDRVIDDTGFALTTTYEYDCLGRMIRKIDPRGSDSLYEFNALDRVVRSQTREVTTVVPVRYERLTFYDANDNVIRIDVENRDDQGLLDPNTHFSTLYEYDILNSVTRTCAEYGEEQLDGFDDDCGDVDSDEFTTYEYRYDANRNRTAELFGESTNGNQPTNRVRSLYDERDLVFERTEADTDPDQSTTRYGYDGNGNRTEVAQGLEADVAPLYLGDRSRVTLYAHDGYDRMFRLTDPMDNVWICEYDANGNRVYVRGDGEEVDVPGDASNVRLHEQACDYDGLDRLTECRTEHYDTASQAPVGDGTSTQKCTWSDSSHRLSCTDDNANTTTFAYDSANRCSSATDARGNIRSFVYDANSNPTFVTLGEKSDLGAPDEVYVTEYVYDSMDRRTLTIDPVGNLTVHRYDSRSNRTAAVDGKGNEVRYVYDGLDRLVGVDRDITDTGDGTGLVVDTVSTSNVYDESSRRIAFIDDNGATTLYDYDALNRLELRTGADGTSDTYTYDTHHNVYAFADPNGTQVSSVFDTLDRLASRSVVVGPGVSGDTTFEGYAYDGVSRLVSAQDDDSLVVRAYDSLGSCTSETLGIGAAPPHTTTSVYDGWRNRTLCVYPGGRQIGCVYDSLNRVVQMTDGGVPYVGLDYVGGAGSRPSAGRDPLVFHSPAYDRYGNYRSDDGTADWRIERVTYDNGTQTDLTYDGIANPPGDSGVKKIIDIAHSVTLGPTLDSRVNRWDAVGNKLMGDDTTPGSVLFESTYVYDSIYRLRRSSQVNPTTTGVVRDTTYDLDGVGNRNSTSGDSSSGGYLLDPTLPVPGDRQVNQYTATPNDDNTHDENGNLTSKQEANTLDGAALTFDYLDRLILHTDAASGDQTRMAYDALGRRISKAFVPFAGPPIETRFYYHEDRVIEERDQSDTLVVCYDDIGGLGFEDPIPAGGLDWYAGNGGDGFGSGAFSSWRAGQHLFYHRDDLGSTVALTDQFGSVVERYEYSDYGEPRILTNEQAPDESLVSAIVSEADPAPFGSVEEAAENVFLGARRVTTLRWWGVYTAGIPAQDRFNIRIYDDAGGLPGFLLYEELGITQAGRTLNGLAIGVLDEHVYHYALSRPFVPPAPGQYWVSVQNDTSVDPGTGWAWTVSSGGDGQVGVNSNFAGYALEPFDLCFEIFTDQSAVENPYLFQGNRYDTETGFMFYEDMGRGSGGDTDLNDIALRTRGCAFIDPDSGRTITRTSMDSLGNGSTALGNNPTSGRRSAGVFEIPSRASGWSGGSLRVAGQSAWLEVFTCGRHSTSGSLGMARHSTSSSLGRHSTSGSFGTSVYVLKKEEGGRHTPFHNTYRPIMSMRTTDVTGSITLTPGTRMVMPGDSVITMRCDTVLLDPGVTLRCDTVLMDPGVVLSSGAVQRDRDSGRSRGFGFVSYFFGGPTEPGAGPWTPTSPGKPGPPPLPSPPTPHDGPPTPPTPYPFPLKLPDFSRLLRIWG